MSVLRRKRQAVLWLPVNPVRIMLLPIFWVTEKELKLKAFILLQEVLTKHLKAGCEGKKNERTKTPTNIFPRQKSHISKSKMLCLFIRMFGRIITLSSAISLSIAVPHICGILSKCKKSWQAKFSALNENKLGLNSVLGKDE